MVTGFDASQNGFDEVRERAMVPGTLAAFSVKRKAGNDVPTFYCGQNIPYNWNRLPTFGAP